MRIAIVGAGMAGMSCGQRLSLLGHEVRLFDKGRGPGEWPYNKRFHLLLNLAVGGWGGQYGIDDAAFPACLEVDSVRVFQRNWRETAREPEQ